MYGTQFKLTADFTNTIIVKEQQHKIDISVSFPRPGYHAWLKLQQAVVTLGCSRVMYLHLGRYSHTSCWF